MQLNKNDFARRLAKQTGRTILDSREIVDDFLSTFADVVQNGDEIKFYGYFTLGYTQAAERHIVVPGKDEPVFVPAHTKAVMRPADCLYKERAK